MTTICSYRDNENERVYVGAEWCLTAGTRIHTDVTSKLVRKGDLIIGLAGPLAFAQQLRYFMGYPERPERSGGETAREYHKRYMVTAVAPAIKEALAGIGYTPPVKDEEGEFEIVVAVEDFHCMIGPDFAVMENTDRFYATGSGADFALGALAACECFNITPYLSVETAIHSAGRFDAFSSTAHDILCTMEE